MYIITNKRIAVIKTSVIFRKKTSFPVEINTKQSYGISSYHQYNMLNNLI